MISENENQVKQICLKIAFLMEHQTVLPDLSELANQLGQENEFPIDYNAKEYLAGARDALTTLFFWLEQKGNADRKI